MVSAAPSNLPISIGTVLIDINSLLSPLMPVQVDSSGSASIGPVNIQSSILAGTEAYIQAYDPNSNTLSNALQITFLP